MDWDCIEKIELPKSLKYIGKGAFKNCTKLKEVNIPEGITVIADSTFYNCSELETIKLPESVEDIRGNAFAYCIKLKDINFTDNLKRIYEYAFAYCNSLTNVILSKSIVRVGYSAFCSCAELALINLRTKNYHKIEKGTFEECPSLSRISIPSNIEKISDYAFSGSGIWQVEIENKNVDISKYAFLGCKNLKTISFIEPKEIDELGICAKKIIISDD